MTIVVCFVAVGLSLFATWLLFLGLDLVKPPPGGASQIVNAGETVTEKIIAVTTQIVRNEL
jgi:alpha-1,3/alpha-1,6-mannosyltransferase